MQTLISVLIEDNKGIHQIPLETRLFNDGNIYLEGEINAQMASVITKELVILEKNKAVKEINLYINSPGGELVSGFLIYDALQSMKKPVNLYCTGTAASMAAVIFASGQKGRRFILPHSEVMIHQVSLTGGARGTASDIKSQAESICKANENMCKCLADHTGRTLDEINEATAFDNYMNAEEAVSFGLCDEIVTGMNVKGDCYNGF